MVAHAVAAHAFPPNNVFVDVQQALQTPVENSGRELTRLLQQQELVARGEREWQAKRDAERMQHPAMDPLQPAQPQGPALL